MHKIGIIGGGQLGKMMILDAKRLDDYFVILAPLTIPIIPRTSPPITDKIPRTRLHAPV